MCSSNLGICRINDLNNVRINDLNNVPINDLINSLFNFIINLQINELNNVPINDLINIPIYDLYWPFTNGMKSCLRQFLASPASAVVSQTLGSGVEAGLGITVMGFCSAFFCGSFFDGLVGGRIPWWPINVKM